MAIRKGLFFCPNMERKKLNYNLNERKKKTTCFHDKCQPSTF